MAGLTLPDGIADISGSTAAGQTISVAGTRGDRALCHIRSLALLDPAGNYSKIAVTRFE